MNLSYQEQSPNGFQNVHQEDATWPKIESAIRALDGKRLTEVNLGAVEGGPYIAIGGGAGRYLVFIWTSDERNLVLIDPTRSTGEERIVVGGQGAVFPSRQVTNIDQALKAARTYLLNELPDQELFWEES